MERVINEIMRRHELLRTSFGVSTKGPVQVIHPVKKFTLELIDLSALEEVERELQITRLAQEEEQRPFDLGKGPLIRVSLLRVREEDHVLFFTMHHIATDAWSLNVLQQEFVQLSEAFSRGQPSPLPELPIQYADFAIWQRGWLQGEEAARQLSYWKKQLAGLSRSWLPTDHPRPAQQTFAGRTRVQVLSGQLEGLKQLSQQAEATLFMTLLAAFKVLFHRLTNQTDIAVGTDIANRNRMETERLIGFFVNPVVLRTDLSGDPTFLELLARVREVTLNAYDHQDLPFEKIIETLKPERSVNQTPLFQVLFVLNRFDGAAPLTPGSITSPVETEHHGARFDLALFVEERGKQIVVDWSYKRELFNSATVVRMSTQFEGLLQRIVDKPMASLSELKALTAAERLQQTTAGMATGPRSSRRKVISLTTI